MAAKETTSITYYVGLINIGLVIIWVFLYGFGVLRDDSINSPTATPFYVGTLFAVGFGIVFPFFEKTMSGKMKINQGLLGSLASLAVYAAMISIYLVRGSLIFLDLRKLDLF